jgi:hypothetical protein
MKSAKPARLPRVKTFAIYAAGATSITAAVIASSLLMSGCAPCDNPAGCGPTTAPQIKVTLNAKAGTYVGQQTVNITAPGAEAIYFSTDGTTPGASNCTAWDGNPIVINDSTTLRVFAKGDTTNYRSKSVKAEYKLTGSPYTNRTALNAWLLLEKDALTSLYCANNGCTVPPVDFLLTEQHWTANCSQGGSVLFDNDPGSLTTTFTYAHCASNGVSADGVVTLTLDSTKLPAVSIIGSDGVTVSGTGYSAYIADNTLRKYTLSGSEGARAGGYDVGCVGAGCAAEDVSYYYGTSNYLWINDPAVPNSCTP